MSVVKAGHDQAADICTGLVQQKIDNLHSQVASGGSLTKQDQHLLVKPTELKAEMRVELRASWKNRDVWERPEGA